MAQPRPRHLIPPVSCLASLDIHAELPPIPGELSLLLVKAIAFRTLLAMPCLPPTRFVQRRVPERGSPACACVCVCVCSPAFLLAGPVLLLQIFFTLVEKALRASP